MDSLASSQAHLSRLSVATITQSWGEAPEVHSVLLISVQSASRMQTWLLIAMYGCVCVFVCVHPCP